MINQIPFSKDSKGQEDQNLSMPFAKVKEPIGANIGGCDVKVVNK